MLKNRHLSSWFKNVLKHPRKSAACCDPHLFKAKFTQRLEAGVAWSRRRKAADFHMFATQAKTRHEFFKTLGDYQDHFADLPSMADPRRCKKQPLRTTRCNLQPLCQGPARSHAQVPFARNSSYRHVTLRRRPPRLQLQHVRAPLTCKHYQLDYLLACVSARQCFFMYGNGSCPPNEEAVPSCPQRLRAWQLWSWHRHGDTRNVAMFWAQVS